MEVAEERVSMALGLPRAAFTVQAVEEDGSLAIALRNVAFLDANGDSRPDRGPARRAPASRP